MSSSTDHAHSTGNLGSEAGRYNREKQQSIAMSSVPVIDLPHKWDEKDALIPESSPAECCRCLWNGDPKSLLSCDRARTNHYMSGRDCQDGPFDCVHCELMRLLLLHIAQDAGLGKLDTIELTIEEGNVAWAREENNLFGNDLKREIFISYDSQSSIIDQYGITRRRMISTGTQWASDLISKCTSLHEKCNAQIDHEYLPTRLIRIQPNEKGDTPRLSLQNSRAVPPESRYVALSYCWGDYKPTCMTTQFDDKNSIPLVWSDLPRTFQDAASFTLALGIEYLWIDSICIIQGDSKDWNHEASKMNAVYKNSYVTLAGLCGYDSRNGLRTISLKESSSPFLQLRTAKATHVLYSRKHHYLGSYIQEIAGKIGQYCCPYPLLSRAWTYQERIVSSRVIFFTESEMIYQCLCHVTCECGSSRDYYGDNSETSSSLNKSRIWSATTGIPDLVQNSPGSLTYTTVCRERTETAARIWRNNVVPEYSKLAVSESRDRLPAIGALAEQFQRARPHEEYLAGLWSGSLLQDLLWICTSRPFDKQDLTNKENLARYEGLPTWTWASIRGGVTYYRASEGVHKARFKASCKYANNERFGILESSRLELEGRVLACTLEWVEDNGRLRPELFFQDGDVLKGINTPVYTNPQIFVRILMDRDQDGFQSMPRQQVVHLMEIKTIYELDQVEGVAMWFFLVLRLGAASDRSNSAIQASTRGGIVIVEEEFERGRSLEGSSSENLQPDRFSTLLEQHSQWSKCEIR